MTFIKIYDIIIIDIIKGDENLSSSANQTIVIVSKNPTDKTHPYTIINLEALDLAIATLKGCELVLWLYIAKNRLHYQEPTFVKGQLFQGEKGYL